MCEQGRIEGWALSKKDGTKGFKNVNLTADKQWRKT